MANPGGQKTAKILHNRALEKYYENPSICQYCGKVIRVKEGGKVREARIKKFCNQTCNGLSRPMKCGKLSAEARQKISKALKGRPHPIAKETRAKLSQSMKGREGRPLTDEHKRRLHDGRLKAGVSQQMRSKLSLHACSHRHKFNNFKHVPYITYTRTDGSSLKLRGSYEIRFAKFLDSNGFQWEYEKPLSFVDKNGTRRWMLPDFFIIGMNRFFDTKGYLSKECVEKIEMVRVQTGINVGLLFLKDIESLEKGIKTLSDF